MSRMKLVLAVLGGLLVVAVLTTADTPLFSSALTPQPGNTSKPRLEFVPGEILIKQVDRVSDSALEPAKRRVGGSKVKSFPGLGIEVWRVGAGMTVGRAVAELRKTQFGNAVEFVEPNWIYYADQMPDDPQMPELWGLLNVGQTGGAVDADIDAPEAWDRTTGSEAVIIGVIDSGVDYLHEDLAANIWMNPGEIPDNGMDDDFNGYVDDIRGWDFVNDDNDPMDDFWHGTHTSGTIGAVGNNGIGLSGVNWDVRIMPLKFLNSGGWGSTDDAIEAVLYATKMGVPITNNSWGGGRKSRALENAIRDSGSLFVASAGNSGSSRKQYPAGYPLDNILSVAATDHDDLLANFSNYGASWVDLAAPGVDVLSTVPGNEYDWASGTSMAAPHVAGVAGLVMAATLGSEPLSTKEQILTTVDPLASLAGLVLTDGRLNAARAVGIEPPGGDTVPPSPVTDLEEDVSAVILNNGVRLRWTSPDDDEGTSGGSAAIYDLRYDIASIDEDSWNTAMQAEGEPAARESGQLESYDVTGLVGSTEYHFGLKSIDDGGNISPLSNIVTATAGPPPLPESNCGNGYDDDGDGTIDCADLDCIIAGDPRCSSCGNNVCQAGEDCESCPEDCSIFEVDGVCGDGVCQSWNGEDCQSCPDDCNGQSTGKPSARFCCGGGDCSNPGCNESPWQCEDSPEQTACCGDGNWQTDLETDVTCGLEACTAYDPDLFLVSYFYDGSGPYEGLTTLGTGSTYMIHNAPGGWYGYPDIAWCEMRCDNWMRAYNHDSVSSEGPGEYGSWIDPVVCSNNPSEGNCCSVAEDEGLPGLFYYTRCCFVP